MSFSPLIWTLTPDCITLAGQKQGELFFSYLHISYVKEVDASAS